MTRVPQRDGSARTVTRSGAGVPARAIIIIRTLP